MPDRMYPNRRPLGATVAESIEMNRNLANELRQAEESKRREQAQREQEQSRVSAQKEIEGLERVANEVWRERATQKGKIVERDPVTRMHRQRTDEEGRGLWKEQDWEFRGADDKGVRFEESRDQHGNISRRLASIRPKDDDVSDPYLYFPDGERAGHVDDIARMGERAPEHWREVAAKRKDERSKAKEAFAAKQFEDRINRARSERLTAEARQREVLEPELRQLNARLREIENDPEWRNRGGMFRKQSPANQRLQEEHARLSERYQELNNEFGEISLKLDSRDGSLALEESAARAERDLWRAQTSLGKHEDILERRRSILESKGLGQDQIEADPIYQQLQQKVEAFGREESEYRRSVREHQEAFESGRREALGDYAAVLDLDENFGHQVKESLGSAFTGNPMLDLEYLERRRELAGDDWDNALDLLMDGLRAKVRAGAKSVFEAPEQELTLENLQSRIEKLAELDREIEQEEIELQLARKNGEIDDETYRAGLLRTSRRFGDRMATVQRLERMQAQVLRQMEGESAEEQNIYNRALGLAQYEQDLATSKAELEQLLSEGAPGSRKEWEQGRGGYFSRLRESISPSEIQRDRAGDYLRVKELRKRIEVTENHIALWEEANGSNEAVMAEVETAREDVAKRRQMEREGLPYIVGSKGLELNEVSFLPPNRRERHNLRTGHEVPSWEDGLERAVADGNLTEEEAAIYAGHYARMALSLQQIEDTGNWKRVGKATWGGQYGFRSSLRSVEAMAYGAIGADTLRKRSEEKAVNLKMAGMEYLKYGMQFSDVEGVGDGLLATGTALTSMLYSVVPIMVGGQAGAKLGAPLGPKGVAAGSFVGSFTTGLALYGGDIYSELIESGVEPERARYLAMRGGVPASGASIIWPMMLNATILKGRGGVQVFRQGTLATASRYGKAMGKQSLKGAPVEGSAEWIAQASVIHARRLAGLYVSAEEERIERLEAGAAGALMGATTGGTAGVRMAGRMTPARAMLMMEQDLLKGAMRAPYFEAAVIANLEGMGVLTPEQQKTLDALKSLPELTAEERKAAKFNEAVDKTLAKSLQWTPQEQGLRIVELMNKGMENSKDILELDGLSMAEQQELAVLMANNPGIMQEMAIDAAIMQELVEEEAISRLKKKHQDWASFPEVDQLKLLAKEKARIGEKMRSKKAVQSLADRAVFERIEREAAKRKEKLGRDTQAETSAEVAPQPAPGMTVQYRDGEGVEQSMTIPEGATLSTGEVVTEQNAQQWLAEEGIAGAEVLSVEGPARVETAQPEQDVTGQIEIVSSELLADNMRKLAIDNNVELTNEVEAKILEDTETVAFRINSALAKYAPLFGEDGVRVVNSSPNNPSGFQVKGGQIVIGLEQIMRPGNFRQLLDNYERAEAVIREEALHLLIRDAIGDHRVGELYTKIPEATKEAITRKIYPGVEDAVVEGHEFFRMMLDGRLRISEKGEAAFDGVMITEETLGQSIVNEIKQALQAIRDYFRDLAGSLARDGADKATIDAINAELVSAEEAYNAIMSGELVRSEESQQQQEQQASVSQQRQTEGQQTTPAPPTPTQQPAPAIEGGVVGSSDTYRTLDGREIDYHYELVESSRVQDHPRNTKPGMDKKETRDWVAKHSGPNYDVRFEYAVDPTFQVGPAMVLPAGDGALHTLGGHRRRYLRQANRAASREGLGRYASRFGINPQAAEGMQDPVIVAVVDSNLTRAQEDSLISQLNDSVQQGVSTAWRATALARKMTPELVEIAGRLFEQGEPMKVLQSGAASELSQALVNAGVVSDVDAKKYIAPDGSFTRHDRGGGAALMKKVLLATVIDSPQTLDRIEGTPMETKLLNGIGPMVTMLRRGQDRAQLQAALEMEAERLQLYPVPSVQEFQQQETMDFEGERSLEAQAIQRWFDSFNSKRAKDALSELQSEAFPNEDPKQTGLFGESNRNIGEVLLERERAEPANKIQETILQARAARTTKTKYESKDYPYLGEPTVSWQDSTDPEARIVNPIDPSLSPDAKVDALNELSRLNRPIVERILKRLEQEINLEGKWSFKDPDRIQAKSSRPSIRAEYPWHDTEHIRDGLRFKVTLQHYNTIPRIAKSLADEGINVIKFDTKKMFHPKPWGWRFVGFDMQMPNGQLVEFYAPLARMDDKAVKEPNHVLFERWRNVRQEEINANEDTLRRYMEDVKTSYNSYYQAFLAGLADMGFSPNDLRAAEALFDNSVKIASSVLTKRNDSMSSTGVTIPRSQLPAESRRTPGQADISTTSRISPVDSSSRTNSSDISDSAFIVEDALDSDGVPMTQANTPEGQIRQGGISTLSARAANDEAQMSLFDVLGGDMAPAQEYVNKTPAKARKNKKTFTQQVKKDVPAMPDGALNDLFDLAKSELSKPSGERIDNQRKERDGQKSDRKPGTKPKLGERVGSPHGGPSDLFDWAAQSGRDDAAGVPGEGDATDSQTGRGEVEATDRVDREPGESGPGSGSGSDTGAPGSRRRTGRKATAAESRREAARVLRENKRRGLRPEDRNHRIDRNERVAPPGVVPKLNGNIRAIELLIQLENENRNPTQEEKEILAGYTGWGGLKQALDPRHAETLEQGAKYSYFRNTPAYEEAKKWEERWGKYYNRLRELLSEDEFTSAMDSVLNAHFTSPEVIGPMWDAVQRLGYKGGTALETSGGIGHFFGLLPESLVNYTDTIGVEIDSLSGRIFAKLYPETKVHITGFESAKIPNNSVDLAISNVPFAKDPPFDPAYKSVKLNLHNYFFAKALDKLKPGGLIAFITSSSTMENNPDQRRFLAGKGELIAAIRLPNTAFKGNANTEVTTDVIFMRKPDGKPFNAENWTEKLEVPVLDKDGNPVMETNKTGELVPKVVSVNEYFARNPQMVLGHHTLEGSMYRAESYAVLPDGRDIGTALSEAVATLPENVIQTDGEAQQVETVETELKVGQFTVNEKGEYGVIGENNQWVPLTEADEAFSGDGAVAQRNRAKVRAFIPLRDHYRQHLELMNDPAATDAEFEASLAKLVNLYNAWEGRFGMLNDRNARNGALESDPEWFLTQGIEFVDEVVNEETGEITFSLSRGDVLSKRTIYPQAIPEKADSNLDAVRISQAYMGHLDIDLMANLRGIDADTLRKQMRDEGVAFENPVTGLLETRERYLSGAVVQKLREAREAAKSDPTLQANVEALEAVQPEPIPLAEMTPRLGGGWIPPVVIEAFIRDAFGANARQTVEVAYNTVSDDLHIWEFRVDERVKRGQANSTRFAGGGLDGLSLLEKALNSKSITVTKPAGDSGNKDKRIFDPEATAAARQAQERLQEAFKKFVQETQGSVQVERMDGSMETRAIKDLVHEVYNERFNGNVEIKFDGSHLTLPGAAPHVLGPIEKGGLRPHQKDGIWRAVQEGYTLLAHGVGSGKTNELIGISYEWKRLGYAKKPMIVVQNQTLYQFATSYRKMYPGAKVLVADKKQLEGKKRKRFMARVAAGDWDAVVIAHSSFNMIPDDAQIERAWVNEQMAELAAVEKAERDKMGGSANISKAEEKRNPTLRAVVQARKRLEARLQKALARDKDDVITFQQMGIDALLVDEAHEFKKVPFTTMMGQVAGLDTGTSEKASGLHIKTRYIQGRHDGRNVVLATGTPVTNTLAEVWNMIRLTHPKTLEEFGVSTFDEFARQFATTESVTEQNPAGDWVQKDRFSKFINGPELISMVRKVFDIKMSEDLDYLNRPEIKDGAAQPVLVKRTPQLNAYLDYLKNAYYAWKESDGDTKKENTAIPLVVATTAKAATLDLRLVFPMAKDHKDSKVNTTVREAFKTWKETSERLGTQLIFADSFQSVSTEYLERFAGPAELPAEMLATESARKGDKKFNVFEDMRKKLVAMGVPAEQIAIINENDTKERRNMLFAKLNSGKVRILMGSTQKMGVGVNVQERIARMHHLDAPWTPADREQRNGRGIRSSNMHYDWNIPVEISEYGVENSPDAARFGILLRKAKFIYQVLSGKSVGREFEDPASSGINELRANEAMFLNDKDAMRKVELIDVVRNLEMAHDSWRRRNFEIEDKQTNSRMAVKRLTEGWITTDLNGRETVYKSLDGLRTDATAMRGVADSYAEGEGRDAIVKTINEAIDLQREAMLATSKATGESNRVKIFDQEVGPGVKLTANAMTELLSDGEGDATWRFTVEANVWKDGELAHSAGVTSGRGRAAIEALDKAAEKADLKVRNREDEIAYSEKSFNDLEASKESEFSEMDALVEAKAELQEIIDRQLGKPKESEQQAENAEAEKNKVVEEDISAYVSQYGLRGEQAFEATENLQEINRTLQARPADAPGQSFFDFAEVSTERGRATDARQPGRDAPVSQKPGYPGLTKAQLAARKALTTWDKDDMRAAFAEGRGRIDAVFANLVKDNQGFDVKGAIIENARDVAALLRMIRSPYVESMKALFLDENGVVLHSSVLSVGSTSAALFNMTMLGRELGRHMPDRKPHGVIVAHNHPSGDPSPSRADLQVTRMINESLRQAGIPLIDHVITNGSSYYSFRDMGIIAFDEQGNQGAIVREPKRTPEMMALSREVFRTKAEFKRVLRDWEAVPTEDLREGGTSPQEFYQLRKRIGDDAEYVFYLNRKNHVVGIEQFNDLFSLPFEDVTIRLLNGLGRNGGTGFIVAGQGEAKWESGAPVDRVRLKRVKALHDWSRQASYDFLDYIEARDGTDLFLSYSDVGIVGEEGKALQARAGRDAPGQALFDFNRAQPKTKGELFREGEPLAMRAASHFMRSLPGMTPAEVKQEARLALLKAAQSFNPEMGAFEPFARRVVYNALKDAYRSEMRRAGHNDLSLQHRALLFDGERGASLLDSITSRVPSPAETAERTELREVMGDILAKLPEKPRVLASALMEGKNYTEIANELGVSRQTIQARAGNLAKLIRRQLAARGAKDLVLNARSAEQDGSDFSESALTEEAVRALFGRLGAKAPDASAERAKAESEQPGSRTVGRPDLAKVSADEAGRMFEDAMHEARKQQAEKETHAMWVAEAKKMLEADREGVKRSLLEKAENPDLHGGMTAVEVKAAKILVADMILDAVRSKDPAKMREVEILTWSYSQVGTEQARAFAARRDDFKNPAERHREFFSRVLFRATKEAKERMGNAPTAAEKSKMIDKLRSDLAQAEQRGANERDLMRMRVELGKAQQTKTQADVMTEENAKRLEKIEEALGDMGVTLEDILSGESVLRLRGAKVVSNYAEQLDERRRQVVEMLNWGVAMSDIRRATQFSQGEINDIINDFRQDFIAKNKAKFKKGLKADAVEVQTELFAQAEVSDAEAQAEMEKALARLGFGLGRQNASFRADIRKGKLAKKRGKGARAEQRELTQAQKDAMARMRKLWDAQGRQKPDTVHRQRPSQQELYGPLVPQQFDIANPAHVMQAVRFMEAAEGTGMDIALELWMNAILSGPQTHMVNITTTYLTAAWDMSFNRGTEALINEGLKRFGKGVEGGAEFAEFKHMVRGMIPGFRDAIRGALQAWDTESSLFTHEKLNEELPLGEFDVARVRTRRTAISENPFTQVFGDKGRRVDQFLHKTLGRANPFRGRVARISFRALLLFDEFSKRLLSRMQVGAEAYRIASGEGLTGEAMERRIAGLINTHGSIAWQNAVNDAVRWNFQNRPDKSTKEGRALQALYEIQNDHLWSRFFLPFRLTPYNIVKEAGRRSPLGAIMLGYRSGKALWGMKDGTPFVESYKGRDAIRHASEQILSWSLTAMAYGAMAGDENDMEKPFLITGKAPRNRGLREAYDRAGIPPYSFVVNLPGGSRRVFTYARYQPIGGVLGLATDFVSAKKRKGQDGGESMISSVTGTAAGLLTQIPMLQGVDSLVDMVNEPDRAGVRALEFGSDVAAGFVPNLFKQLMRAFDPNVRDFSLETGVDEMPRRIAERTFKRAIPAAGIAPERIDVWGQPVTKEGNVASRLFSPTRLGEMEPSNRIDRTLVNFARQNPDKAWAPQRPSRRIQIDGEPYLMNDREFVQYQQRAGQLAWDAVQRVPLNQANPSERDIDRIKRAVDNARDQARREFRREVVRSGGN